MASNDGDPQTLVETAGEIMQNEIDAANDQTAQVIEAASEAINQAQEDAERIAEAAMQTEIGRRVGALESRGTEWLLELGALRQDLQSLTETVSLLQAQVAATATLTVATALTEPDPSLSIPQQSSNQTTMAEAMETVTEVVPGALSESIPDAPLVPEAPQKRHRFL